MNIQQLIDNAKQSLNAPQHHHHALMKALRAALNVQRVQQCVRFRVKIQNTRVQNNQVQMVSVYA